MQRGIIITSRNECYYVVEYSRSSRFIRKLSQKLSFKRVGFICFTLIRTAGCSLA